MLGFAEGRLTAAQQEEKIPILHFFFYFRHTPSFPVEIEKYKYESIYKIF